jgi:hypothetical protein
MAIKLKVVILFCMQDFVIFPCQYSDNSYPPMRQTVQTFT